MTYVCEYNNDMRLINNDFPNRKIKVEIICWDDDTGGNDNIYNAGIDDLFDIDGKTSGELLDNRVFVLWININIDPYKSQITSDTELQQIPVLKWTSVTGIDSNGVTDDPDPAHQFDAEIMFDIRMV